VLGQTPIGSLDGATCKYAGGWAKAPDSDDPISVHLWFDNDSNWVRGTTANIYRADVGNHAFHYTYDEALLQMLCDGGSHQVAAYGIWGTNPQLGNSPRTVSCGYFVKTGTRYNCCASADMVIDENGSCVEATYYKTFDRYTGPTTIVNRVLDVSAYCPADNMCVDMNSSCVTQYTPGRLSSSNVDDKISYCGGGANPDAWIDCDYSVARCSKCGEVATTGWMEAGATGVGEYGTGDGGDGITECCGDDRNEYIITGNGHTACCSSPSDTLDANGNCQPVIPGVTQYFKSFGGPVCDNVIDGRCVNGGDDPSDTAVCDNDEYCVYSGTCFVQGSPADLTGNGRRDGWCMTSDDFKGRWRDCDNSSTNCSVKCLADWSAGGESSAFGEYNSGTAEECCGDDAGEFFISYDGRSACCDSPDDIINASGQCVSSSCDPPDYVPASIPFHADFSCNPSSAAISVPPPDTITSSDGNVTVGVSRRYGGAIVYYKDSRIPDATDFSHQNIIDYSNGGTTLSTPL
jgi:hypothetical protein